MLGYAAVDLSPLLASFPSVTGWYNIFNWVGRCRGQLKVSVVPRAPLPTGDWQQQQQDSCLVGDQQQLEEPRAGHAATAHEYFAG